MKHKSLLIAGLLSLLVASVAPAQRPAVPATLAGSWRCAVPPQRARAIAMAAFQPRIAALPAIVRPLVRSRIENRMRPPTEIEIVLDDDRVRVTNISGSDSVVIESSLGRATQVRGLDGETRRVVQRLRGGWLEQVFEGENGTVSRLLSTEPDGETLHADVTVTNERLGAPVRWRIDFTR